jgi:energy-coupling factor transport system permease protein
MRRIDPRILIIQIAISGLCAFWIFNPIGMLCEILFLMGFLLYLRLPKDALWLGLWFAFLSALYALVSTYNAPQTITQLIFLLRKLSPLIGVMVLSLRAMTVSELIAGLQGLRCPKAATLALAVALRFIPTIQHELSQIRTAMKTRGIPLNLVTFAKAPAMTTEYMAVPFMMRCTKIADELSAAAVTRAIENPAPRGLRIPMKLRARDVVYLALVICTNLGTLLYSLSG